MQIVNMYTIIVERIKGGVKLFGKPQHRIDVDSKGLAAAWVIQVLDHVFATRSLLEKAEFDIVHVNVDFSHLRNDTVASDHEPLVGRFSFKD